MGIQSLCKLRTGHYKLRGRLRFTFCKANTSQKRRCVSFLGVNLWNDLSDQLKLINSRPKFRKTVKG